MRGLDEDIEKYIQKNKLPLNPIYGKGYNRVGCWACLQDMFYKDSRLFTLQEQHPNMYKTVRKKFGEQMMNLLKVWAGLEERGFTEEDLDTLYRECEFGWLEERHQNKKKADKMSHYVIDKFVAHLRKNGHPDLHVDRGSDGENRDSPDIDATAGPFVIEFTSIDVPPDQRLLDDNRLPNRLKKLCNKKAEKLAKYQGAGKTTVLLIALMHPSIKQVIRNAYPNGIPSGVDKIWFADTTEVKKISSEGSDITFEDFTPS